MQKHDPKPLIELKLEDLGGGLNESGPPSKIADNEFVVFKNARTALDGTSIEKRPGLSEFDSLYSFGGKRVHGAYGVRDGSSLRTLVCLQDSVRLKSSGAWSTVFSPTATIDRQAQVCQFKGLTFIAGYEKILAALNEAVNYAGIEAPASPPTVAVQAASSSTKSAEYPVSNQDKAGELRSVAPQRLLAQGFKATSAGEVTKVTLKLRKIGSPSGNLWVEIHSAQAGTSFTKNASTSIVGQASDNVAASGLGASFASQDFTFSGTKPSLIADTTYYLVVYGDYSVSSSNFVIVGFDASSPTYSNGSYWTINGSYVWSGDSNIDLVFEVWVGSSTTGTLISYGTPVTGSSCPFRDDASHYLMAQSFKLSAPSEISKVRLALSKRCIQKCCGEPDECPPGNIWAEIHSSPTGTSATKNASASIVGQASDDVAISSLGESFAWADFTFSGTKPSLSAGTTYYIVLYATFTPSLYKYLKWSGVAGYPDGSHFDITSSMSWSVAGGYDHVFEVIGTTTTASKIAENPLSLLDDIKELRETAAQTLLAQAFQADIGGQVSSIKLWLAKMGSPATNVWVEIHSSQGGTSGTKNASANIVGQASDNVATAGISAFPTYTQYTFTFSGTKPTLVEEQVYYLVAYGDYVVSSTDLILVAKDKVAPSALGSCWGINGSYAWTELAGVDLCYEVWTVATDIVGDYSYVVTFVRGGSYPCESNPSPPSVTKTIAAGQEFALSDLPISTDPQVTGRRIYRTYAGGETHYYVKEIADNTTTTTTDSLEDIYLGDEVFYDHDRPPAGTAIENWDGKLWVSGVVEYPELIFKSKPDEPEHFDLTDFLTVREKEAGPVLRLKEFNNDLFAFKAGSIWQISRSGVTEFAVDKLPGDVGLGAVASLIEIKGGVLIFLSNHYQIEIFTGSTFITPRPDDKAARTLATINKAYAYRSVAGHYNERNEYRLAIPTGSSQWPDTVIVFDYARNRWAVDTHPAAISSMDVVQAEQNEKTLVFGTTTGKLWAVDEAADNDAGYAIAMDVWHKLLVNEKWTHFKRAYVDLECPAGGTVTFRLVSNMSVNTAREEQIAGSTPTGGEADLRALIHHRIDMNVQGNAFSWRILNSDLTGRPRISRVTFYVKQRAIRQTIKAD